MISEDPVDYIFSILVERFCIDGGAPTRFQLCQDCQIPRQVVSVSDKPAGVHANLGELLG